MHPSRYWALSCRSSCSSKNCAASKVRSGANRKHPPPCSWERLYENHLRCDQAHTCLSSEILMQNALGGRASCMICTRLLQLCIPPVQYAGRLPPATARCLLPTAARCIPTASDQPATTRIQAPAADVASPSQTNVKHTPSPPTRDCSTGACLRAAQHAAGSQVGARGGERGDLGQDAMHGPGRHHLPCWSPAA